MAARTTRTADKTATPREPAATGDDPERGSPQLSSRPVEYHVGAVARGELEYLTAASLRGKSGTLRLGPCASRTAVTSGSRSHAGPGRGRAGTRGHPGSGRAGRGVRPGRWRPAGTGCRPPRRPPAGRAAAG